MSHKMSDFLFSFGLMIIGVFLLFGGTVFFNVGDAPAKVLGQKLPLSNLAETKAGGDQVPLVLPAAKPTTPLLRHNAASAPAAPAAAALVVNDQSHAILFEKEAKETRPLASLTKLMSALVLNELPLNWEESISIATTDVDIANHIKPGEEFTLNDLWNAGLVGSSNSAISALARATGLTTELFAARMNERAAALNLRSLNFVEPTGLNKGNVGNALDVARLLEQALKEERIEESLSIQEYYLRPLGQEKQRRVWSTNWLLTKWIPSNFSPGQVTGKTGYIEEAGYNLAVRFNDGAGHAVRVVILGSRSNESRFNEARDLADWAFSNYLWPDMEGYQSLVE